MPFFLGHVITEKLPPLWGEKFTYRKENLYRIHEEKFPPVNYDSHYLNVHSLTHIEFPAHTQSGGKTASDYKNSPEFFYGACDVIRLKGNNFKDIGDGKKIWEVSLEELVKYDSLIVSKKVLLTVDEYPIDKNGFHDPNSILVLSKEAARFLIDEKGVNLYGTSWKSSDYNPGGRERVIHNILFENAVILECLNLKDVPVGTYFISCMPILIDGASELPVSPVLFLENELSLINL